jgi:hypothetical protein
MFVDRPKYSGQRDLLGKRLRRKVPEGKGPWCFGAISVSEPEMQICVVYLEVPRR